MKKNFAFVLLFTLILILIFTNKEIVQTSAVNAFTLWQTKIFPSLFIMFVMQDLLISYNAAYFLNLFLNNIFSKIFGLSLNGQMAFTLSLFSGSPSNAFILNELVSNNKISIKEANHILSFSYFANPLFLFTMLSFTFENNISFKIIAILYFSNILLGISSKKENFNNSYDYKINNNNNFGNILTNSIKKSINTLIMILGSVSFFMIISSLTSILFTDNVILTFISGLFEITAGLNNLINLNIQNDLKEIIAVCIISFGGISIHSQVYAIITNSNLSYKSFIKGRIFATLIAILLILII